MKSVESKDQTVRKTAGKAPRAAAPSKKAVKPTQRTTAKPARKANPARKAAATPRKAAAKNSRPTARLEIAKAKKRATRPKKAATRPKKAATRPKKVATRPKKVASHPKKRAGARADFGAPIDGFFRKQPPNLRPILEALRALVEEVAPDANASIKWGMPFYAVGEAMLCALGSHKSHVNLILSGPPSAFADPEGRLSGTGKLGRHLKITTPSELPTHAVRGWLRTAAKLARSQA